MRIRDRIAIVTGAASGLGYATTRRLIEEGAKVAALDMNATGLAALADEFGADRVLTRATDVVDETEVEAAVSETVARFGRVEIVVNCAGVADAAKTVSSKGQVFPLATWNKVIGINLTGSFNVIRFAAREMMRNAPDDDGQRGVIVNTASGAAWGGQAGQAAYSASKAGVMGMTLPIARDLAPQGIRVVAIAPGLFDTQMVAGMPAKVSSEIIDRMILFPHRMGNSREFAALVESIVTNPYLNATTISLDAGVRTSN
ncbi:MAG: SDR family NAD(P)-dependent oxidoreductase [Burkholderiaceae bacterium]